MKWQDFVVGFSSMIFVTALIVQVRAHDKPPLATSTQFAVACFGLSVAYASLKLWFGLATTVAQFVLWLTVARQKVNQSR